MTKAAAYQAVVEVHVVPHQIKRASLLTVNTYITIVLWIATKVFLCSLALILRLLKHTEQPKSFG